MKTKDDIVELARRVIPDEARVIYCPQCLRTIFNAQGSGLQSELLFFGNDEQCNASIKTTNRESYLAFLESVKVCKEIVVAGSWTKQGN